MSEARERSAVVAAAKTWLGTPYHEDAWAKGFGVDCAHIILEAFVEAGAIERFTPARYRPGWHLHRNEEVYLETVLRFAAEIPAAPPFAPATVLLWRHGRTFSHGAIVTAWPNIIHASAASDMVEEVDVTGTPLMRLGAGPRPMRAFDRWA